MASLRSLFPELGRILNMTPPALYGRQVAFIRARLLKSKRGHGPGSGVPAKTETLVAFLIAEMTNASHAENVAVAREMMGASIHPDHETGELDPCELTGQVKFVEAFATILNDPALAARVNEVVVSDYDARIIFDRIFPGAGTDLRARVTQSPQEAPPPQLYRSTQFLVHRDPMKMFEKVATGEVRGRGIKRVAILEHNEIQALAKLVGML
jgi:hypothetical protein